MRRNRRRATLLLLVALLAVLPVAEQARASCAGPIKGAVKRAPWVFVGTATQQDVSTARLDVEQVWRGPDLAPTVFVQTGQTQPPWPLSLFIRSGSSGDATLEPGTTYVVAVEEHEHRLLTNNCVVTEATRPLLTLAPDDARAPVEGAVSGLRPGPSAVGLVAAGTALVLALVIGLLIARRRRRA